MATNRNRGKGKYRERPKTVNKAREMSVQRNLAGILASQLSGNQESGTYYNRLTQGAAYADFETDIADFKTNILDQLIMYLVSDNSIDKWNATQVENYENLIVYGTQLLVELKNQYTQIQYVPTLTRSDSTAGSTFTRSTLLSLGLSVTQEIKIPPVCYAIAELYTTMINLSPLAYYEGKTATFFMPFRPHKTATEIEALLTTITGYYDAVVYATQAGAKLVPVDMTWLRNIVELPVLSWYGNLICEYYPINYDNGGGETESFPEIDETTDIYWHAALGVPEYFDALALFRSQSCADNPAFIKVENIANDKLGARIANINSTSFSELSKASGILDWIYHVIVARSAEPTTSPFHATTSYGQPFANMKSNVRAVGPTSWDLLAALWLKRHFNSPSLTHLALHNVGPDLTASILRRTGTTAIGAEATLGSFVAGQSSATGFEPGSDIRQQLGY